MILKGEGEGEGGGGYPDSEYLIRMMMDSER